jgi:hypothetical protein
MSLEDVVFFRSLAMGRIRRDPALKAAYEVRSLRRFTRNVELIMLIITFVAD